MTASRLLSTLVAAIACGLVASSPSSAVAQDAASSEKPKASSARTAEDRSGSKSNDADAPKGAAGESADSKTGRVVKSPEEWQKILTPEQFMVTRLKATEPAFSGKYATGHFKGTFLCVCCGARLFDSRTKFESGTGWPSFWQPIAPRALSRAFDSSEYEPRIEVMCARCGAHLGHVFEDGPPPTGLRYCINSLSLKLDSEPAKTTTKKASARGSRRRAAPSSSRSSSSKNAKSTSDAKSGGS